MQERITYLLGERYERLRLWLAEYSQMPELELDHFLSRLFGEVLSQPGFGFHGIYHASYLRRARGGGSQPGRIGAEVPLGGGAYPGRRRHAPGKGIPAHGGGWRDRRPVHPQLGAESSRKEAVLLAPLTPS